MTGGRGVVVVVVMEEEEVPGARSDTAVLSSQKIWRYSFTTAAKQKELWLPGFK